MEKKEPNELSEFKSKEINELGLNIVAEIEASDISYKNNALHEFFRTVSKKCNKKNVWVLFGSNDKETWYPLQAASAKNIVKEIKDDFKCMLPYDKKQDKPKWDSYFYKNVMEIDYGLERKCQKYRKIREKYKFFAIAVLKNEEGLEEKIEPNFGINGYQKAECDLACKLKPLLWNPNPFTNEKGYLESEEKHERSQ